MRSEGVELEIRYQESFWRVVAFNRALGGFEIAAGRFENETHTDTQAREHVDQRVSAEEINPASKQITHPRLRYTENFSHLGLREAPGCD